MINIGDLVDDRYRLKALIGHGGMADVYEAQDIITRKTVAFKIIRKDIADEQNIKRFEYEARAAAALNHPNIVKVLNIGSTDGIPYIVNEYIKGQTLRDALDFRGSFSYSEACQIMLQLTDAVSHAHMRTVLHCDIKTNNVFIEPDGSIKLGDFGLAIIGNTRLGDASKIAGSVHYLAPEISQGHSPSPQSDIYAMGVTFFELLTGKLPFDDGNQIDIALAHVKKAFPSLKKYLPNAPKEIEKIILKATRKNPLDRYVSAKEMHDEIAQVMDNTTIVKKKTLLEKIFGFKGSD